ncbi:MAG: HlyD family type I secretion periplasmic adaptor subunit, partial [Pirellulales bacterium]|nr:HlyD family type I secretion periplasmic adaptor subunit [Pirellulales bacterium]
AEIRELVIAPGEIIPSGRVQQVQHLEGGEIETFAVVEGQIVDAGTPLVHLRPIAATSDLNQLRVRAASLYMRQQALTAVLSGQTPEFGEQARRYPEIAASQREVFRTKKEQLEQDKKALTARIAQKQAETASLEEELASLQRQLAIQREQLEIREELLKDGYTSRRAYLTTKTALEEATAKQVSTTGRLRVARQELIEAKSNLQAREAEARKTLSEERSQATAELGELEEQIAKHRDRVARTTVRAPVKGIVQELAQSATGEVVRPGDLVAKLVPVDQSVVAEVRVDPADIGHVKQGDPVEVTFTTFDPSIFGVAKGSVKVLSATTFVDEKDRQPFYKAVISLEDGYVGQGDKRRLILPGMVVQANIITGSKSLVKYLLKPVYRSLDRAFSER